MLGWPTCYVHVHQQQTVLGKLNLTNFGTMQFLIAENVLCEGYATSRPGVRCECTQGQLDKNVLNPGMTTLTQHLLAAKTLEWFNLIHENTSCGPVQCFVLFE